MVSNFTTQQGDRIMAKDRSEQDPGRPRVFWAHKKAKNSEVVEALAKKGITITANYVGNIKATHNKRQRSVRKVVAKGGVDIPQVKAALAFLKLTGSVKAATPGPCSGSGDTGDRVGPTPPMRRTITGTWR